MLDAYKTVKALHELFFKRCKQAEQRLPSASERDLADAAYMLEEISELLEDSRKECDRLLAKLGTHGVMRLVTKGDGEPLCGTFATAHAKISKGASVPSFNKDPDAYREMCEAFGVAVDPLQRLHFPAIKKYMADVMEHTGGILPPNLEKYAKYEDAVLVAKGRPDNTIDTVAATTPGLFGEL